MGFNLEQRGKQNRIEGAPGKKGEFLQSKLMLGREKRDSPSDNMTLFVKLSIWDACQVCCELLLAHLRARGQMEKRNWLASFDQGLHDVLASNVLRTIEMIRELLYQQIKGRVIHRLPFLFSSLQSSGLLMRKS